MLVVFKRTMLWMRDETKLENVYVHYVAPKKLYGGNVMTAQAKNALRQAKLTLPPQALPSAGYKGFSQL